MTIVLWVTRDAHRTTAEGYFRRLQLFSAAAYSYSHGTNDAQKTMGIIVPLLFSIGYFGANADPNNLPVPLWVILIAHAAIALRTLTGGGDRAHHGVRITNLRGAWIFCRDSRGRNHP
jgi:PiT family inorganic phosphate transporter